MTMGDYGWSMDFGTSQGSVAVERMEGVGIPQKIPERRWRLTTGAPSHFLKSQLLRPILENDSLFRYSKGNSGNFILLS